MIIQGEIDCLISMFFTYLVKVSLWQFMYWSVVSGMLLKNMNCCVHMPAVCIRSGFGMMNWSVVMFRDDMGINIARCGVCYIK